MKELKTGFLMLFVCTALYIQVDPRIWSGICQLLARLLVVVLENPDRNQIVCGPIRLPF
jgi:hypothetical protein